MGKELDTYFIWVKYASSRVISALSMKQTNAAVLISRLLSLLIWTVKTTDPTIVGIEILKHWQRLKVYGMFFERYFRESKIELLKQEVKSSTDIKLKTHLRLLISKNQLREAQVAKNQGSAIVITAKKKTHPKGFAYQGYVLGASPGW